MHVRMRSLSAGPRGIARPGQVVEVSRREGEELLERGFAEPVADAKRRSRRAQNATAGPSEDASGQGGSDRDPEGGE